MNTPVATVRSVPVTMALVAGLTLAGCSADADGGPSATERLDTPGRDAYVEAALASVADTYDNQEENEFSALFRALSECQAQLASAVYPDRWILQLTPEEWQQNWDDPALGNRFGLPADDRQLGSLNASIRLACDQADGTVDEAATAIGYAPTTPTTIDEEAAERITDAISDAHDANQAYRNEFDPEAFIAMVADQALAPTVDPEVVAYDRGNVISDTRPLLAGGAIGYSVGECRSQGRFYFCTVTFKAESALLNFEVAVEQNRDSPYGWSTF